MRSTTSIPTGILNSLLSTAVTIGAAYYIYLVFWVHASPDLHITVRSGISIPPETYPMILLAVTAAVQMINIAWGAGVDRRSSAGRFFFWEDLIEAILFAVFLGLTLPKVGSNPTYLVVLVAFLLLSIVHLFLLILLRFSTKGDGAVMLTGGTTTTSGSGASDTKAEGRSGNVSIPATLVFTHMRLPGGQAVEIPETLELIPIEANTK